MSATSGGKGPILQIPPTVKIEVGPLTLEKITSNDIGEPWGSLKLGSLPNPGHSRSISRMIILMKIRQAGLPEVQFARGINRIKVKRPGEKISSGELKKRIVEFARETLANGKPSKIIVKKLPRSLTILPGPYQIERGRKNPYGGASGSGWQRFRILQSGQVTNDFRAQLKISHSARVAIAKKPVDRGSKINKSMITWKKKEITDLNGSPVTSPNQILGMEAKRQFSPGEIIFNDRLRKPVVIDRMDKVTIVYELGNLRIQTEGEAKEEGTAGELIKVENLSSEKEITARVVDERTVKVNDAQ